MKRWKASTYSKNNYNLTSNKVALCNIIESMFNCTKSTKHAIQNRLGSFQNNYRANIPAAMVAAAENYETAPVTIVTDPAERFLKFTTVLAALARSYIFMERTASLMATRILSVPPALIAFFN